LWTLKWGYSEIWRERGISIRLFKIVAYGRLGKFQAG